MSIETGCICYKCKKWHSHISEYGFVREDGKLKMKYVCVNCKRGDNGRRGKTKHA